MQPKRKKQKPKQSGLLEFGKIYKITTTVTKVGERQVLLPALFYFKPVSSDKVTYTIEVKILRAGDSKAWDMKITSSNMQMISEYVDTVEQVTDPKELTKVLVRGM